MDGELVFVEPWAMPSARDCLEELHTALHADLDASKAVPTRDVREGTSKGQILGIETELPTESHDLRSGVLMRVQLSRDKAVKYYTAACKVLDSDVLASGVASKLVGRFSYAASDVWEALARFCGPCESESKLASVHAALRQQSSSA